MILIIGQHALTSVGKNKKVTHFCIGAVLLKKMTTV